MTRTQTTSARMLLEMLTRMRPAGSKTERRFIREYLEPLGVARDPAGNLIKRVGQSQIAWCCHTDTVHKIGGNQLVTVENGLARIDGRSRSNCLGADDTVGVWLMREMILAAVPGLYLFHRGEEVGGIGSSYIATQTPDVLKGISCAIALDRKGKSSIITHQGARCCSDDFAFSLSHALASQGLDYAPDDSGLFTDTANYTDIVGECSNLSVGYARQHTANETLDLTFALRLRNALLSLDTSRLVIARKPGEIDPDDYSAGFMSRGWGNYPDSRDTSLLDMVRQYPDAIADLLSDWGYDKHALRRELYERGEAIPLGH